MKKQASFLYSHSHSFKVAILGSPNVGKSTLFNILTDSRDALVKDQPGVTRDIHIGQVHWDHHQFEVIDTGGLTAQKDDAFSTLIKDKIQEMISFVDCLIIVMDGRAGLCPEDISVVELARQANKPFLVVVNKVDNIKSWDLVQVDFCQLGCPVYSAAFERRVGVSEVLDWIVSHISSYKVEEKKSSSVAKPALALIGRPNVGKSSLCNRLYTLERMLVTEKPGTTTDSIQSLIEYKGKSYTLIDTAGMRNKSKKAKEGLEVLASYKTKQAMGIADINLLLIDGLQGPSHQDARLVDESLKLQKPVILLVNKTDLGQKGFRKKLREQIKDCFHFITDIPIVFISAKTGLGLDALFVKIEEIWKKLHFHIPTSQLNKFFANTITQAPSPFVGSKPVKFYYLTQTKQVPPSFIAFMNEPKGLTSSYKRFLIRKIKQQWSLFEVPIRIFPLKKGS